MQSWQNILIEALSKIEIDISDKQIYMFSKYMDMLLQWNENINLTAITQPEEIAINEWEKYYEMDSKAISLLKYLYNEKMKCFTGKIVLNDKQKKLIPGGLINSECIESLYELNIYCK